MVTLWEQEEEKSSALLVMQLMVLMVPLLSSWVTPRGLQEPAVLALLLQMDHRHQSSSKHSNRKQNKQHSNIRQTARIL